MATKKKSYKQLYGTHKWKQTRLVVLHRDKGICQACKKPAIRPECDHVKPLYKAGANFFVEFFNLDNLQILCRNCHFEKTRQEVAEWHAANPNHKPRLSKERKQHRANFQQLLEIL